MKYLISISILLYASITIAQEVQDLEYKKFSIALFIGPTLNHRILISSASTEVVKELRDESEIPEIRYQSGIFIGLHLNKFWEIRSGINYSDRVFRTKSRELNWFSDNKNKLNEAYISQRYLFIDIPVNIKYNILSERKLNYFLAGGMNASLLMSRHQRNHVNNSGSWEINQNGLLKEIIFMCFGEVETGIEYDISSKIKLTSSVFFQQAFTPTNPGYLTKEYLNSMGIRIGAVYKF